MFNFRKRIAIDLGTTSVLVYSRSRGVILNEPSVVAINRFTNKIIAVGQEAKDMLGKTPGHIVAVRPIEDGVIKDYESTERMLQYYIRAAIGRSIIKPNVIICVPSGATQVQKRAVKQAGLKARAYDVHLIEEPLAAAIGSGVEIEDSRGNLIIDIGGGTTDIAVISRGGIVVSESIKFAGNDFDKVIIDYIRKKYNLIIGERTAENIKLSIGTIDAKETEFIANGRNIYTGLPEQIEISVEEIDEAFEEPINEIANAITRVLSKTPPELVSDIYESGTILAGGGALIRGIKDKLSDKLKIGMSIAENPVTAVVRGTGKSLNWINKLEEIENSKLELTRRIVEDSEELRRR